MIIRIEQKSAEPIYLQIRSQIIKAIAQRELAPGDTLPSVRSLASDLGINLHTVNKAYAVLRDEGYVLMKGRSGAFIADPSEDREEFRDAAESLRIEDDIYSLALAYRARGGAKQGFLDLIQSQVKKAFDEGSHGEESENSRVARSKSSRVKESE